MHLLKKQRVLGKIEPLRLGAVGWLLKCRYCASRHFICGCFECFLTSGSLILMNYRHAYVLAMLWIDIEVKASLESALINH